MIGTYFPFFISRKIRFSFRSRENICHGFWLIFVKKSYCSLNSILRKNYYSFRSPLERETSFAALSFISLLHEEKSILFYKKEKKKEKFCSNFCLATVKTIHPFASLLFSRHILIYTRSHTLFLFFFPLLRSTASSLIIFLSIVLAYTPVQSRCSSFSINHEKCARVITQFRGRSRNRVTAVRGALYAVGIAERRVYTTPSVQYDSLKR